MEISLFPRRVVIVARKFATTLIRIIVAMVAIYGMTLDTTFTQKYLQNAAVITAVPRYPKISSDKNAVDTCTAANSAQRVN